MFEFSFFNYIKHNKNLYNYLISISNIFPQRLIHGKKYYEIISLLRKNEKKENEDIIKKLMRKRLAIVLSESLAFVPYYKETIKINPTDINEGNAEDILRSFPFLDKRTVIDNHKDFINIKFSKSKLIFSSSSGSTGAIKLCYSRSEYVDIEKAFFDYEWGKIGYEPKCRIVRIAADINKQTDKKPCEKIGNRLLISPFHLNSICMEKIYNKIIAFNPDFFHSYPSCLQEIAKFIIQNDKPVIRCKGLFLASEAFTPYQYELFRKAFSTSIIASYGLSERSVLAFTELDEKKQDKIYYKLNNIYGYTENLIDEFGNPEIIGTSYWNTVMPLIRYRTQDFGEIENGVIKRLDGRAQEYLITKSNHKISGLIIDIENILDWRFVESCQVIQNEIGKLVIRIVPKPDFNDGVKNIILEQLENKWNHLFDFSIEIVNKISRANSGKFRMYINNILNLSQLFFVFEFISSMM